jgi:hypothetical protein
MRGTPSRELGCNHPHNIAARADLARITSRLRMGALTWATARVARPGCLRGEGMGSRLVKLDIEALG